MIMLNCLLDKKRKFGGMFSKPTHRTWLSDLNQGTKVTLHIMYRLKGIDELNPPETFPWTPRIHYDHAQLSTGQTGEVRGTFGKPTHRTWLWDLNQGTKETLQIKYRWKGLNELNPPETFPWTPRHHYDHAQLSARKTGEV